MRQLLLPVCVCKKHITQPASEQFSPVIESLLLPPALQGCLPDLPNVARSNYMCGEWPKAVFPSTLALQLIAAGRARGGRARRAWAMSAVGAQPGRSGEARNARHAGTARAEPCPRPRGACTDYSRTQLTALPRRQGTRTERHSKVWNQMMCQKRVRVELFPLALNRWALLSWSFCRSATAGAIATHFHPLTRIFLLHCPLQGCRPGQTSPRHRAGLLQSRLLTGHKQV